MAFYSGYACDKCGRTVEFQVLTADRVLSITHLRRKAKSDGWSVGKKELLCNKCRSNKTSKKKTD